ncbi:glycosyltransferase [Millisia brevis]|uniref:glycosyltransferase n=1 Tax=Millisia brevis TaxID=264148 RepID=UPI000833F301|nr:nucleotide disphospho-sugar-binding domain-containing protein [Millisia brevis]
MRFVLAANGSRGDVQPAVAIGTELRTRGHEVSLLVPPNLVAFGAGAGLPTRAYGRSTKEILESDTVRVRLKSANPRTRLAAIAEMAVRGGREMHAQLLDETQHADAIVSTSVGQERAHNVAQVRGIAHIPLHLGPIRRNSTTSLLSHVGIDAPGWAAAPSWSAAEWLMWMGSARAENRLRAELGLPALRRPFASAIAATGVPEIQAYDPALFPDLVREWGSRRPLVGFLNLPAAARRGVGDTGPDDDLLEWLAADEPPVYVGFGSMMPSRLDALAAAVLGAARELGLRLLIAGGWSDFMRDATGEEQRIRVVGHIDHDAILPHCRAAIHHGGAGSVAAGLRAGLPTIVTWIGADQPMWGQAVSAAHVGTHLPMSRITSGRLADALRVGLSATTRAAAQGMREQLIPSDRAAAAAADLIERTADTSGAHPA